MLEHLLLADLTTTLPGDIRYPRLVSALREHFHCGAVGLLQLEPDGLRPLAVSGLVHDTLGRSFRPEHHPRLAAILASRQPTRFPPGSTLPDPYDGLLDSHRGQPLPVHDCMGISLHVDGQPWGVLTLDALEHSVFDTAAQDRLASLSLLIETMVRVGELEKRSQQPAGKRLIASDDGVPSPLGNSPQLQQLLQEIDTVAEADLPVLLLGETGTGKELFAHRLHQHSRRAARPLLHVNCAALPESLAESELFGHARGAFSGAGHERVGRIEAADGGTLFLDEVGELPLNVQAKLLRTLQNGEIQRLGADRPHRVDVRIIAATNRDLPQRIRDGQFRADLYHRLSVYPLPIPPLRERGNDVLLLAGHFLEQNRSRLGLRNLRLSPAAELALCHYPWPGNVRELEHVISRAALRAASRAGNNAILTLEPDALALEPHQPPAFAANLVVPQAETTNLPLKTATDAFQRKLIRQQLAQDGDNWAASARALGLDASNLHKLARRLGLKN